MERIIKMLSNMTKVAKSLIPQKVLFTLLILTTHPVNPLMLPHSLCCHCGSSLTLEKYCVRCKDKNTTPPVRMGLRARTAIVAA